MDSIIVENFRCFKDKHILRLKPLTILVGENSTGKTSLLAAIRIAGEAFFAYPDEFDFNQSPFLLGAYNEIASNSCGRHGRSEYFVIGKDHVVDENSKFRFMYKFTPERGHPKLIEITIEETPSLRSQRVRYTGEKVEISYSDGEYEEGKEAPFSLYYLINLFNRHFKMEKTEDVLEPLRRSRVFPYAPVRIAPRRSNDPRQSYMGSYGDHIPQVLREIYGNKDKYHVLINELNRFGQESGLFKALNVSSYGGATGPFRVNVKISGNLRNLLDVGYGVSQVLPIVVDSSRNKAGLFLLQQPEIHLHPRAQAELGSFLGKQVKTTKKRFVVETHSDYLLDRLRYDIRDGCNGLRPEDVGLLFFYRKANQPWVDVHEIEIDAKGDLKNPPEVYREFFVDEQRRLFNIKK